MRKKFFLFFSALLLLAGCEQIKGMFQPTLASSKPKAAVSSVGSQETGATVQGTVLAKINNAVITLESFDEKVKAMESLSPDIKINTPDAKKGYLNDLVMQELIVQESKARGIDKLKDIKDAVEEFKKGAMVRQIVLDETKGITVQPAEIEAFYNQYKKEFAAPEEIRVREIVVSSEAIAKEILISLLQGADFASVAKERSISPTASKGGDLGLIKLSDKFENFGKAVAVLDAGQISPIFKGPEGFYIVKVEEKKGGSVPPLAEVYDQIKNGLLQQKQTERIKDLSDRLKRDAKIEIKEDLLR
ncbi:MAG: peptidyl-prolyl cis-trans isomerase [Candidatus Omnitrophica bacterium]|nr:peptidyl-prolyl cis-trans isomerase [Candidatus Omnitrophota bacterium]